MNEETYVGYRERAGLVGRTVLGISIAPAVFLLWHAVGLPSIPGLAFGAPSAHADDGVVVGIAHRPGATFVPSLRVADAALRRGHRPPSAAASKSVSVQPRVIQPQLNPDTPPDTGSAVPQAPTEVTPAAAPEEPAADGPTLPVSTPTVPLPVQVPPLPVQVPPVVPPLPPPVSTVVSNPTPPGLP